jgi:TetR/AcrR family transcriptional regulator, transcriptional repressor for nem operon
MRYSTEHKLRTRKRIVDAAAAAFRQHGYAATGIDAVMAAAKLTAGAFYAHFRSKRELLTAAVDQAFRESRQNWPKELKQLRGRSWVRQFAWFYLSPGHRDSPDVGCPMPSLTAEVRRNGNPVRNVFERRLSELVETIAQEVNSTEPDRARAISAIALSVGGLMLARGVKNADLSNEILASCRTMLTEGLIGPEAP